MKIKIGDIFRGYCNGYFTNGTNNEYSKRCEVEAIGDGWIVVRHLDDNTPDFEELDVTDEAKVEMMNGWMK